MIQRIEYKELSLRLQEDRPRIQVLTGPRQVGKTTLVKQVLQNLKTPSLYVSADEQAAVGSAWIHEQWSRAEVLTKEWNQPFVLAIDEIQKIPGWSETVKRRWDESRDMPMPLKLLVTGSSRLMLEQGLGESLAGRYEQISLPHWRYTEMREAFGFTPEQYAWFGAYPGAAEYIADEERWKAYVRDSLVESAISRDVLQMTRVDKPVLLRRLFELGSSYSGQILSYTKMLGQLQDAGNTTTLAHYLHLLEEAGLLAGLDKYAADQARKRGSSPKFQVLNPALRHYHRAESFAEALSNPSEWGRVVESCIGSWLLLYSKQGFATSYWKRGDLEVDFIVSYKRKIIAIEVKTGYDSRSGMSEFISSFSPHRSYLIGKGGLPWQEVLKMNPENLF